MTISFVYPVGLPSKKLDSPRRRGSGPCKRPRTPLTSSITLEEHRDIKLPAKLHSIADHLAARQSGRPRYLHLIELGDSLSSFSPHDFSSECRVKGCVAVVYIHGVLENGRLRIRGWADSKVVRGLVAMVIQGLDGCSVEELKAVRGEDVVRIAGLGNLFAGQRMVGLNSLLDVLRSQVGSAGTEHANKQGESYIENGTSRLNGVWTAKQGKDVAVLLSGGVDSSVAMRRAMEEGMRPHPFYLKIWLEDELAHLGECPWEEDVAIAQKVCDQAGVKFETVSMQQEYWDRVVKYTIDEARAGRTPNPDVMCNSRVKFGAFYDRFADQFDRVVTGHYAKTCVASSGLTELRASPDLLKDQTYFLAHLRQEQVSRAWFPIGEFTKTEVRALANKYELPNKSRKDSQGICFLGKLKFAEFLEHYLGKRTGRLVDYETGDTIGAHPGYWFFTLGQRRGIGLSGGPWYVVSKNMDDNVVYVSRNYHLTEPYRTRFLFENASWIAAYPPVASCTSEGASLSVKIRHGIKRHMCTVKAFPGGMLGQVELKTPDKALAPGQFAVFYDNDVCLGSAVISLSHDKPEGSTRLFGETEGVTSMYGSQGSGLVTA